MDNEMTATSPEQNKALVLEAFDTLFNKRDYAAAERFWSDRYIQHSAQCPCSVYSTRSPKFKLRHYPALALPSAFFGVRWASKF